MEDVVSLEAGSATAQVALYGSTVIAWRPKKSTESLLFMSKKDVAGKPYRGGIPLVFPLFGAVSDHSDVPQTLSKAPRHGFARDRRWKTIDFNGDRVTMSLTTQDYPELRDGYPFDFELHHSILLTETALECTLKVKHLSSSQNDEMAFHALFHNYLALPSQSAKVAGLQGRSYRDKLQGGKVLQESQDTCSYVEPKDSVYLGGAPTLRIGEAIELKRSETLPDTTLWNPGKEAGDGMSDLHNGGWKEFVCAEPGHVASFVHLAKGQEVCPPLCASRVLLLLGC